MPIRKLSITELPNELTSDIDLAEPLGIVRLLRQIDSQILNGYLTFPALSDEDILLRFEKCIELTTDVLKKKNSTIILSGAGTSGRLAMFIARTFNKIMPEGSRIFRYLIAGGNLALIKAQEGAEDDPNLAVVELEEIVGDAENVLYVGITCGMSAPYIAGQLDWCFNKNNVAGVLLGFSSLERARDNVVEDWDKTFREVSDYAEETDNCVVLNPVVGPEPITGSTRMKGGSATKLMLEVMFFEAARRAGLLDQYNLPERTVLEQLDAYEQVRKQLYQESVAMSDLVQIAGDTLRCNSGAVHGNVYYLGEDTAGMLGLVDASECPPTFGAHFSDVRGFVDGGWETLLGPGKDMSSEGQWYRIGLDEFEKEMLPNLNECDLVVGLGIEEIPSVIREYLMQAQAKSASTVVVVINGNKASFGSGLDVCLTPRIEPIGPIPGAPFYAEYALKLTINALTSGGHILAGKVFGNRMVDLRISNNKLFFRTIGIISSLMGVSEDVANESIIKSIYETDAPTESMLNAPISQHIAVATNREKVVPVALLLATGHFNYEEASAALKGEPIVRNIIGKFVG